ncbi:MAG: HNH endonuclease [Chloroflexota bacterium]
MAEVGRPCPSCRKGRDARRPSAAARGYGSRWRRGLRARQLRREPICQYVEPNTGARCSRPATDSDHVVPKRLGGEDALCNLQSLCHAHHSMKTASETGWGSRQAVGASA